MTAGSNELGRVRFRESTLYNKVEEKRIPMTSKFAGHEAEFVIRLKGCEKI